MQAQTCPQCQKTLVVRTNSRDGRKFFGCLGYRDGCRYTRPLFEENSKQFQASPQQRDIIDDVLMGRSNILVNAGAGTGKSTTALECCRAFREASPDVRITYTCFNKSIATEFASIAPTGVQVSTMHSIGYAILRNAFPNLAGKPCEDKTFYVIDSLAEQRNNRALKTLISDKETGTIAKSSLAKIVGHAKNQLLEGDEQALIDLAARFGIDTRDGAIISWVAPVLETSKTFEVGGQRLSDFDDMIYLPIVLNLPFPTSDLVVIDECQDLNPARQQFALRLGHHGRILAIGDRYQSIYGFNGADTKGMDTLERLLGGPSLRTLSYTRRCPTSHVKLVNNQYPEIPFHAFDGTPEGKIVDLPQDKLVETAKPNDLIMCRVNAPLVALFFKLIKARTRAIIIGRKEDVEILLSAVKSLRARSIPDLLTKIEKARAKELDRAEASAKGRGTKPSVHVIEAVNDKYDILREIAGACKGVADIEPTIRSMFGDNGETKDRVRLSSVHRAKGLEAHRTFVVAPELMPHPKAETPEELDQERNIWYVAHTRCKVVKDDPESGTMYIVS